LALYAAALSLFGMLPAVAAWTAAPADPGAAGTYTIAIENMRFTPSRLTVRAGDRVVWVNKDLVPHTATAPHKAFDSGSIAPTTSWAWVARRKGELRYACSFHPTMSAILIVR
jgi:plastocyanin